MKKIRKEERKERLPKEEWKKGRKEERRVGLKRNK